MGEAKVSMYEIEGTEVGGGRGQGRGKGCLINYHPCQEGGRRFRRTP